MRVIRNSGTHEPTPQPTKYIASWGREGYYCCCCCARVVTALLFLKKRKVVIRFILLIIDVQIGSSSCSPFKNANVAQCAVRPSDLFDYIKWVGRRQTKFPCEVFNGPIASRTLYPTGSKPYLWLHVLSRNHPLSSNLILPTYALRQIEEEGVS